MFKICLRIIWEIWSEKFLYKLRKIFSFKPDSEWKWQFLVTKVATFLTESFLCDPAKLSQGKEDLVTSILMKQGSKPKHLFLPTINNFQEHNLSITRFHSHPKRLMKVSRLLNSVMMMGTTTFQKDTKVSLLEVTTKLIQKIELTSISLVHKELIWTTWNMPLLIHKASMRVINTCRKK